MENAWADNYRFLARYNRWINQRLYDAAETLNDEERQRERGAFFGSIHRTLNHLVVADQIWLRRFVQCGLDNCVTLDSLDDSVLDLPGAVGSTRFCSITGRRCVPGAINWMPPSRAGQPSCPTATCSSPCATATPGVISARIRHGRR